MKRMNRWLSPVSQPPTNGWLGPRETLPPLSSVSAAMTFKGTVPLFHEIYWNRSRHRGLHSFSFLSRRHPDLDFDERYGDGDGDATLPGHGRFECTKIRSTRQNKFEEKFFFGFFCAGCCSMIEVSFALSKRTWQRTFV